MKPRNVSVSLYDDDHGELVIHCASFRIYGQLHLDKGERERQRKRKQKQIEQILSQIEIPD